MKQFNTLIDDKLMSAIKKKGIRYAKIVELGVQYLDERTALHEELMDLREGNKKLQNKVSSQGGRLLELERLRKEN